jgi:hypothetical protein
VPRGASASLAIIAPQRQSASNLPVAPGDYRSSARRSILFAAAARRVAAIVGFASLVQESEIMSIVHGRMRRNPLLALVALAASLAQPAMAQTAGWTERPFDPPVGSRWIVESRMESEEERPGGKRAQLIRTRSEMTVNEKLPTGFRISYVMRDLHMDGQAPGMALAGEAFQLMKDIVIRATTDASGKPVGVENLADVQEAMKTAVRHMADGFKEKPRMQAVMQQMLTTLLIGDEKLAARMYLDDLPQLSIAQNTGLKTGEIRRTTESVPNPFGGKELKSNVTLRIDRASPRNGDVRLTQTSTLDPAALLEMVTAMIEKFGAAADKPVPPQVLDMIRAMKVSVDATTTFDVEDGMTRFMRTETLTRGSVMGQSMAKREIRTVTVTPDP